MYSIHFQALFLSNLLLDLEEKLRAVQLVCKTEYLGVDGASCSSFIRFNHLN